MARKITVKEIELYLLKVKRIRPEYLFGKMSPAVRQGIIDDCFRKFAGFKLTKWGLALAKNPHSYHYRGYKNYKHIENVEGLTWDINHTLSLKRSYQHQLKRKVYNLKEKKRKQREARVQAKKIITKHKEKWRIDHTRQDRIKQIRTNKSQDRER